MPREQRAVLAVRRAARLRAAAPINAAAAPRWPVITAHRALLSRDWRAVFGWDYATLARRVRHKFGGIKVY